MPKSHWLQNESGAQVPWEQGSGRALEALQLRDATLRDVVAGQSHRVLPALPEPPCRASWHQQMDKSPERRFVTWKCVFCDSTE